MRRPRLRTRLRLLACAAAVALLPLPARADPISVFIALEAVVGATAAGMIATAVSFVATYGAYFGLAAQVVGSMDARRRARHAADDARRAYNASLTDRTAVVLTADPPLRAVYGRCIVGGDVVAVLTSDKQGVSSNGTAYTRPDGYKQVVIVCAARKVSAIHDVLLEGVGLGALDADGWPTTGTTVRTGRGYREVTLASGASFSAGSVLQVMAVGDASGVASYNESGYTDTSRPSTWSLSGDGKTLTNTSAFAVIATVAYDTPAGAVRVSKFLGGTDQLADAWLLANVPGKWLSTDRLRGLAGVVLTLDLEDTSFQGGIPKIELDVSGHEVFDPRTNTTAFSANPALIIRDYLTSEIGFGVPAADIDDAYVIAAANACDVLVDMPDGVGISAQPRYTCHGTMSSEDGREAVLDDLADCMAGQVVQSAQWMVLAGGWEPTVLDLGDDDLAGQAEVLQGGAALDDLFNGARARIIPDASGTVDEPVPYQNSAFVALDGEELWTDVQLPYTNSRHRARNILRVMVERNRDGLLMRVPCKMRAWPLQVGDRVRFSSSEYGLVNTTMQVLDWQFGLGSAVVLTLQADRPELYDQADATAEAAAQISTLPPPWVVAGMAGLSATSGTATLLVQADGTIVPRVRLSWPAVADSYLAGGGFIRVAWRRARLDQPDVWHEFDAAHDAIGAWLDGVAEHDALTIYARVHNRVGAVGAAQFISHQVVGKSQPASNVTGLGATVTNGVATWRWDRCTDVDYGVTEVRAVDANWGQTAPAPLWRGKGNAWPEAVAATGMLARYVRHVDTSGNPSTSTANYSVNVLDEDLAVSFVPINKGTMNADPGCEYAPAWEFVGSDTALFTLSVTSVGAVGRSAIRFGNSAANGQAFSAESIPISAARRYRLTARLLSDAPNDRNMYIVVRMFRSDGSELSGSDTGWGGSYAGYVFGGLPTTGWDDYGSDFGAGTGLPVPADVAYVRIGVWGQYSGGSSTALQFAQDVRMFEVTDLRLAQAAASAAAAAAGAAQDDADAANLALADIASDNMLTRGEKPAVMQNWAAIAVDGGIGSLAVAYGITTELTAYDNAVSVLASYLAGLTPGWSDLSQDTPVLGPTFRAYFGDVYSTRQVLLNKISALAGTMANWDGVSGANKPDNNATYNRVTYSATEPSSPRNGEVWVDVSASPAVIRLRVAGAWQDGANLSTGLLAQLNAVLTAHIGADAVDEVGFIFDATGYVVFGAGSG